MTYMDYMREHPEENFSWCKCYTNPEETHYMVMYDGLLNCINTPSVIAYRYGSHDFDAEIETLAREVNEDYDLYSEWDDIHIALDAMHEIGCWHCPFKDECEAMGEEMSETDWR